MITKKNSAGTQMSAHDFRKKLRNLILMTWNIPPVFGLTFILFINILNLDQLIGILITPLEPTFIIFWILFSIWYFGRFTKPVEDYLNNPVDELAENAAECIKKFPLHYWGLFLTYIVLAPTSVIVAAELYTDYVAQPIDWFRIHLVALIVSIIVGLPIFFLILDLFGRVMGSLPLSSPHVTIKTKVFLIGALIPLLIDTILVQYFWTRTGYFTSETFIVWLVLELLAIGGSLIFVKSFAQSLNPLEHLSTESRILSQDVIDKLLSQSSDEIGVLTKNYQRLLSDLKIQSEMLELNNRLLSKTGYDISIKQIADMVVSLCASAFKADKVFLMLFDEEKEELVGVAQTSGTYKEEGYFRLGLDDISMAVMVFKAGETMAVSDVKTDPRCNQEMKARFEIQSALASPLIVEGRPIGVLMVVSDSRQREYSDREITIIEGFAREVGIAIHTHRLSQSKIKAEEKGREHQEHIELLMKSTEEGIYGVDLNGMCTFVNPACLRMLGYNDESEILGENIHELIHHTLPDGSRYPKEECKVRLSTLRGVSGHSADEVHWRKDGTSFPVEYWSHPIRKNGEIVGTVVSFVDITERNEAEKTIRHMAYHDALTGLYNRNEFEVQMANALMTVDEAGVQHALLYLDLDQFKVVNDSSGHEAGDQLLRLLANIIQKPVPKDGVVARLGGDEFGIILHDCSE
ncbi:MAG: diguanylate cyclase, partial [Thiohalophilus sp.]